jgi:hypothetical protein
MNISKLSAVAGIAVLVLVLGLFICSDRGREKNLPAVLPPASPGVDAFNAERPATITPANHDAGRAEIFTVPPPASSGADALNTSRPATITPVDPDAGLAGIFIHADEKPEEVNHLFHWEEDADWFGFPQDVDEDPLEELGKADYADDDDDQRTGRRRNNHFRDAAGLY